MSYYPIMIDLAKWSILVVGGGEVAERKVKTLLDCGGRVSVLSPVLSQGLATLANYGKIDWWKGSYAKGDLEGFSLVIATTDSREVNNLVAREARQRGILVNVVDDISSSNFIVPSSLRRGELVVSVSTSGASPALAHALRERLEGQLGPEWGVLTRIISEVRHEVRGRGVPAAALDWGRALDLDKLLALISSGEEDRAKQVLLQGLHRH